MMRVRCLPYFPRPASFAAYACAVAALCLLSLRGAAVADSRTSDTTLGHTAAHVGSLRAERTRLRARLQRFDLGFDDTSSQMAEMNYSLTEFQTAYEHTFAQLSQSLSSMYKLYDEFAWATVTDHFGLDSLAAEYDFFGRVGAAQTELVDELRAQTEQAARLRDGISALKQARLELRRRLVRRLAKIDAALAGGTIESRQAQARLATTAAFSAPPPALPEPGLGGLFAAVNKPPDGIRPSGVAIAGLTSWYGPGFDGHRTADGETYDMFAFTCASRTLPFDTWLRVTFQGRAVFVRVNDRGPVLAERVLDLSYAAAEALGFSGVVYVEAEIWR